MVCGWCRTSPAAYLPQDAGGTFTAEMSTHKDDRGPRETQIVSLVGDAFSKASPPNPPTKNLSLAVPIPAACLTSSSERSVPIIVINGEKMSPLSHDHVATLFFTRLLIDATGAD